MNAFRRFCTAVHAIAGLLVTIALGLAVVGPWQNAAQALLELSWYRMAVFALLAILAFGHIILLLRVMLTRHTPTVDVETAGGGRISVTTNAIASQAMHVIEAEGDYSARKVDVKIKRGRVYVDAKVLPRTSVGVVDRGPALRDTLTRELRAICGDKLERVDVEFLEAQEAHRVALHEHEAPANTAESLAVAAANEPIQAQELPATSSVPTEATIRMSPSVEAPEKGE